MRDNFQKTLIHSISLRGVGLHTGIECELTLKPASENVGIFFTRIDLENKPIIFADVNNVVETNRGTTLQKYNVKVHTVEHVLSVLYGLGIDNANVELSGPEPPILDGSALPFVNLIRKAGIKSQKANKDILKVDKTVRYKKSDEEIEINILPYDHFKITFFMDYGLPDFGVQYTSIENVAMEFEKEIAPARTFGLLSEIEMLKENNLIKGGSLENAVVFVDKEVNSTEKKLISEIVRKNNELSFKKGTILNSDGLRFDNEPVRHKVLDLVGDLALFGKPILGHVIAKKSGHSANIELVKELRKLV